MTRNKQKSRRDSRSKSRSRSKKSRKSRNKSRRLRGSSIWPRHRTNDRTDQRDSSTWSCYSRSESPRRGGRAEELKVVHVPPNRRSCLRTVIYTLAIICFLSALLYGAYKNHYLDGISLPRLHH
ncbi:hypothetical protein BIW11_13547 [Tropilaelaps mercedesae]|uniref:Uncharacterized protein n=1 Tax=Tropilaelaps mercedesae TaxID=418985 RepID=A0A1V9X1Y5_9ACAR|nr:hypothetical protein BIW11_13547 [Tropilaelaps mercedesae]